MAPARKHPKDVSTSCEPLARGEVAWSGFLCMETHGIPILFSGETSRSAETLCQLCDTWHRRLPSLRSLCALRSLLLSQLQSERVQKSQKPNSEMGVTLQTLQQLPIGASYPETELWPSNLELPGTAAPNLETAQGQKRQGRWPLFSSRLRVRSLRAVGTGLGRNEYRRPCPTPSLKTFLCRADPCWSISKSPRATRQGKGRGGNRSEIAN